MRNIYNELKDNVAELENNQRCWTAYRRDGHSAWPDFFSGHAGPEKLLSYFDLAAYLFKDFLPDPP